MKFYAVLFSTLLALAESSSGVRSFHPYRISLDRLVNDRSQSTEQSFLRALTEVGMMSITGIDFKVNKQEFFSSLQDCAEDSRLTHEHIFEDGTRRLTMATHTLPGPGGVQVMHHESKQLACNDFSASSDLFRQEVAQVTEAFAHRLSSINPGTNVYPQETSALLQTKEGYSFDTFADVVVSGEHLEHFHCYQHTDSPTNTNSKTQDGTIQWHTDQGLFIVFTPARLLQAGHSEVMTEGFSVELKDGSRAVVQFDDEDDVVIMLGDGVNQYINSKTGLSLRATPHAVQVPNLSNKSRVWYGRMVLPPASAIHPEHGVSFGEIRNRAIASMSDESVDEDEDISVLACSLKSQEARRLQTEECEADTLRCWHRCMSTVEFNATASICEEQGLDLACINPRQQLWTGLHGDYYPACIDIATADNHTDFPLIEGEPRSEQTCSDDAYEEFCSMGDYEFEMDLGFGAVLMWSITDDRKIRGRLTFNGLFGWLAIGFPSVDGKRNGMHGAKVLMALPGGDFSPVSGLDLSMDYTVKEYVVAPGDASFRHWEVPLGEPSAPERHLVEETECFTAMTFETDSILDQFFTVDGTDRMIWAANAEDTFVGYHTARGFANVTWAGNDDLKRATPPPVAEKGSTSGVVETPLFFWMTVVPALIYSISFF